jgi:hypothetical protein
MPQQKPTNYSRQDKDTGNDFGLTGMHTQKIQPVIDPYLFDKETLQAIQDKIQAKE